jgi:hypothetical protein
MDLKNINYRLEIIKLAIKLNDEETIKLQTNNLLNINNDKVLEIVSLLQKGGLKQASYLIKKFQEESDFDYESVLEFEEDEKEYTLSIDDMLKMSPIAKETIKEFKSRGYTKEDLQAFAKNISASVANEQEEPKDANEEKNITEEKEIKEKTAKEINNLETFKQIQKQNEIMEENSKNQEFKENGLSEEIEIKKAIDDANNDTPLDEISAEIIDNKDKKSGVLNSYKTLRAKFGKNKQEDINKQSKNSLKDKLLNKKSKDSNVVNTNKASEKKEIEKEQKKEVKNEIYAPIPHIEHKFRQLFTLYPPLKESDIWVEEVVKFLKFVASNSYTEDDVKKFFEDYLFYLEKGDIARASQVLLLAAATDSKYARFVLARELFKGKVLKRDFKKSFAIMKQLANSGYADAICDLAQFYEYGIEVPKDTKIALKLYEKAFELGVNRATKHINRLKESSGLLGALKKIIG